MKFLLNVIVIVPTLIAVLLFTVAGLSFNFPELLAAATSPAVAICCIVAGVFAMIPLIIAAASLAISLISGFKKKKIKPEINGRDREI